MRLLFFLAAWKRPEITEICFMGLTRLKNTGLIPIDILAVISEESMIPLCKKYNIDYCFYKNQPLGEKKNYGLTQCFKKSSWTHLVELGSDDILKNEVLEIYKNNEYNLLSIGHFAFLNSENGECRSYKTKTQYGLGRMISREALEKTAKGVEFLASTDLVTGSQSLRSGEVGFFPIEQAKQMQSVGYGKIVSEEKYKIWNDSQVRGLDNTSSWFLNTNFVKGKMVTTEKPIAFDIKSEENIWAYNPTVGEPIELEAVLDGISEDEKTAIKSLIKCPVE